MQDGKEGNRRVFKENVPAKGGRKQRNCQEGGIGARILQVGPAFIRAPPLQEQGAADERGWPLLGAVDASPEDCLSVSGAGPRCQIGFVDTGDGTLMAQRLLDRAFICRFSSYSLHPTAAYFTCFNLLPKIETAIHVISSHENVHGFLTWRDERSGSSGESLPDSVTAVGQILG